MGPPEENEYVGLVPAHDATESSDDAVQSCSQSPHMSLVQLSCRKNFQLTKCTHHTSPMLHFVRLPLLRDFAAGVEWTSIILCVAAHSAEWKLMLALPFLLQVPRIIKQVHRFSTGVARRSLTFALDLAISVAEPKVLPPSTRSSCEAVMSLRKRVCYWHA